MHGKKVVILLLCASLSTATMNADAQSAEFTHYDKIMAGVQIASLAAHCAGLYLIGSGTYGACTASIDRAVRDKVLVGLFLYLGSAALYATTRPCVSGMGKLLKSDFSYRHCDTWPDTLRYIFDDECQ